MTELRCPNCGKTFNVDEKEMNSIVQQLRNHEFEEEVERRTSAIREEMIKIHAMEISSCQDKLRIKLQDEHAKELQQMNQKLQDSVNEARELQLKLDAAKKMENLEITNAIAEVKEEKNKLEQDLMHNREIYEQKLKDKDQEIALYRDMKAKMSTKMVGESLEKHCETEFNKLRMTAFPNAYFEKDNDIRTGSKGDYIYREMDELGNEIISIMFEMKNEQDTTSTKHKNEDFFKELDKDRKEKGCEYAVLVSLLEQDSDYYNGGIVDVSYKYDKMYVVRPQCFIPIITLLRNAAMNALAIKRELAVARNQNLDITNFENNLSAFKENFGSNYRRAHDRFDDAISEIDKTIDHLNKVKENLLKSDNQLRLANDKVEDITVKKLTRNCPTVRAQFDELKNA